jgi:hypothetical protein
MVSMSDFQRCRVCGKYDWLAKHKCAPVWEARLHETKWEEGWSTVYAIDAEEAAEKFCEQYDSDGEYSIVQSGSAEVEVRKPGEDVVTLFGVDAETVPQYRARERKAE